MAEYNKPRSFMQRVEQRSALVDDLNFWHIDKTIAFLPSSEKNKNHSMSKKQNLIVRGEFLTVFDHYFYKNGVYVSLKETKQCYKAARQRHFLDFRNNQTAGDEKETKKEKSNLTQ